MPHFIALFLYMRYVLFIQDVRLFKQWQKCKLYKNYINYLSKLND